MEHHRHFVHEHGLNRGGWGLLVSRARCENPRARLLLRSFGRTELGPIWCKEKCKAEDGRRRDTPRFIDEVPPSQALIGTTGLVNFAVLFSNMWLGRSSVTQDFSSSASRTRRCHQTGKRMNGITAWLVAVDSGQGRASMTAGLPGFPGGRAFMLISRQGSDLMMESLVVDSLG